MRVLALDTTTRAGSVALVENDQVIAERRGDPSRSYAERLPLEILALLGEQGRESSGIDLFAVASGPGSFTGLRVGIATIQGLAFVHNRRVAAVSALDALAQAAGQDLPVGAMVGIWTDAQRRDVFTALYEISPAPLFTSSRLKPIDVAAVGDPASTLARWSRLAGRAPLVFSGDGSLQYRDIILAQRPDTRIVEAPPLAGVIGLMASHLAAAGETITPGEIRPFYIRRPDAEVDREKRNSAPPVALREIP
ncbi:MAG: tRNA (adenosine(37)-N6)-threonylcarbamoyltransferase complex dimerization subunit type 1 TsaB [Acidobacteriota bacterium]